jgi:hypothetical protein
MKNKQTKKLIEYIKWLIVDNGKYSYWGKVDEPKVWKLDKIKSEEISGKGMKLKDYFQL